MSGSIGNKTGWSRNKDGHGWGGSGIMEGEGGSGGVESICTVKQKDEEIIEGGLGGTLLS